MSHPRCDECRTSLGCRSTGSPAPPTCARAGTQWPRRLRPPERKRERVWMSSRRRGQPAIQSPGPDSEGNREDRGDHEPGIANQVPFLSHPRHVRPDEREKEQTSGDDIALHGKAPAEGDRSCYESFRIWPTASIVLQPRVVTGTPKIFSS